MNQRSISVTTSLIIINIAVFLVGMMVQKPSMLALSIPWADQKESAFFIFGSYSWFTCFMEGQLWRLISYQFVHANLGHILFNMWALYFFGPAIEDIMGSRKFLAYYLTCGVAGALFSSLLASMGLYASLPTTPETIAAVNELAQYVGFDGLVMPWQMIPMVGASAAIYGVMVAAAFLYPEVKISLLFPPVTLKLRTFAMWIIGIASFTIIFNLSNAGGEAGHLGGIIMGAIIMIIWKLRYKYLFGR